MTLLLLTLACGEKDPSPDSPSESDADTDADADTDTDSDTDADPETGFAWDGGWYPLGEGSMYCQEAGGLYTFSGGSLRDGSGPQANGYAYFSEIPGEGSYPVVALADVAAGNAAVGVADFAEGAQLWYSNGASGSVTVADHDGELWVSWGATELQLNAASDTATTTQGHMRCTP
jgi:hypothetical protein